MSGFPSREAVVGILRAIQGYGGTATPEQQATLENVYGIDPFVGVGSGYFAFSLTTQCLTLTPKGTNALKSLPV